MEKKEEIKEGIGNIVSDEEEKDIMEEWGEERKPSIWLKIIVIAIIVLIIIFFATSGTVREILYGIFKSSKIKGDFSVDIKDIDYAEKLIFINNSYSALLDIYEKNKQLEFKVCLLGYIEGKDYIISEIFIPEIYFQSATRVVSEPCPSESLISLHSHPELHCLPSDQDMTNYKSLKLNNEKAILAVMCSEERFNFFIGDE